MKTIYKKELLTLVALLGAWSGTSHSMPSKNADHSPLSADILEAISNDPALKGVQVLADHDPGAKVFYVTPAHRKFQAGNFVPQSLSQCNRLENQYEITYSTPENRNYVEVAADPSIPVSNFFFIHFAHGVRERAALKQISDIVSDRAAYKEAHSEEFGEYYSSLEGFQTALQAVQSVKGEMEALDKEVERLVTLLTIAQPDQIPALREALADAQEKRRERYPILLRDLNEKESQEYEARQRYLRAYAEVAPHLEQDNEYDSLFQIQTRIYDRMLLTANNGFEMSEVLLKVMENRTIGYANASVKIWDDEAVRVDRIIKSLSNRYDDYTVVQAPIHNVIVDGKYWESVTQTADGSGTEATPGEVISKDSGENVLELGEETVTDSPYRDENGAIIPMKVRTVGDDQAFTLNIPVSMGTYCMGQNRGKEEVLALDGETYNTADGEIEIEGDVSKYDYISRNDALLKPSITVNYSFFIKAEPMDISCELNMEKYFRMIQSSGSSGFLFWKKSWSNTDRTVAENNGLVCKVNSRPISNDINAQRELEAAMIEQFSRDLAAEALLLRGKSWDMKKVDNIPLPSKGQGFANMGTAVIAVCGGNLYCTVGGIVLKSLDELFGSRTASGNTTDHYSSRLTREFRYDGFIPDRGSVTFDLEITE